MATPADEEAYIDAAARLPQAVPAMDPHCLIVDDYEPVRKTTATVLARLGFLVTEAVDGEDARSKVESADLPIDLLITDLAMPNLDGFDLIRWFRKARPDARILVLSGTIAEMNRLETVAPNIPMLIKPVTPDQLIRVINITMDFKALRRA